MLVVIVEPGKQAYAKEIQGTLNEMRDIVGGTIQAVYPFEEPIALICNDEGKLLGLPPNRGLRDGRGVLYDVICGTFFLCAVPSDSDRFESLSEQQVQWCLKQFQRPELILSVNGILIVLPME